MPACGDSVWTTSFRLWMGFCAAVHLLIRLYAWLMAKAQCCVWDYMKQERLVLPQEAVGLWQTDTWCKIWETEIRHSGVSALCRRPSPVSHAVTKVCRCVYNYWVTCDLSHFLWAYLQAQEHKVSHSFFFLPPHPPPPPPVCLALIYCAENKGGAGREWGGRANSSCELCVCDLCVFVYVAFWVGRSRKL